MAVKLRDMDSDPAEKAMQVQERKFFRYFFENRQLLAGKRQRAAGGELHNNRARRRARTAQLSAIIAPAGSVASKGRERRQCRPRAKDKTDFFADQLLEGINHD